MNQVVTLTGYEEKKRGESKRGPWALRLFTAAGGTKFQTFDVDLGDKLIGLLNKSVEVEYEIEDREYTDNDGNSRSAQNNVVKAAKALNGEAKSSVSVSVEQPTNYGQSDRELRIMRQSALDRAINTVAAGIGGLNPSDVGVSELYTLADGFIDYFENGK